MCYSLQEVSNKKKILINKAVNKKKIRIFQFHTGLPRMLYPLTVPKFCFIFGPGSGYSVHGGSFEKNFVALSTNTNPEN